MEIISPVIESYLEILLPSHHPILREMEAEAAKTAFDEPG